MGVEGLEQEPAVPAEGPSSFSKAHAHELSLAVRNTLKLASSLLITWSVALIVKLQVPAHLGPIRQGHFGFAEGFAGMFFTAVGLGVDTYVIKEVSVRPGHASDFVGGVFVARVAVSFLLFAAMGITLHVTGRPLEIQLAVVVFGLYQLVLSINGTLASVLQATTKVGRLAVANVAAKIIWGAGLLLGLHYGVSLYVLALPMLASEALRTAFLVPAVDRAAELRYQVDFAVLRKVLIASFPFFVGGVAVTLGNNLAVSTLEFMCRDEREVGWFAATQNLATLAMLLTPLLSWVVMPLLSRAQARSQDEMMMILRRSIEGLVILIAPITLFISVASDVLIKVAFGPKYAPASTALSILSLVFVVTYINMMLSSALVVLDRSWSVTIVSLGGIFSMAGFMIVFVALGRRIFHEGGESAGAAMAVIANEACVVVALLSRFQSRPLDARNVRVLVKTAILAVGVYVVDHFVHSMGPLRLLPDAVVYIVGALAMQIVRVGDVMRAVRVIRTQKSSSLAT